MSSEETPPPQAESAGEGAKKRNERKRDETPIEDLYDLSQPIPKVSLDFDRLEPIQCALF